MSEDPYEVIQRSPRAPGWVRAMTDRELHAVGGRFVREQQEKDLTGGQEWLLDQVLLELDRRRRRTRPGWQKCSCALCFAPF